MDLKTVCNKGIKFGARRRVGRGVGSGLGKTSGRGHKGWGQRSGAPRRPGYEGGQMPIYRRVPKRGFTNASFRTDYTVINVDKLGVFADGDTVDLAAVIEKGLVSMETPFFKVLGNGKLERKLTIRAQKFTASAKKKIEEAGGTVVALDSLGREMPPEPEPEAPKQKRAPKADANPKADAGATPEPEPEAPKKKRSPKADGGATPEAQG